MCLKNTVCRKEKMQDGKDSFSYKKTVSENTNRLTSFLKMCGAAALDFYDHREHIMGFLLRTVAD